MPYWRLSTFYLFFFGSVGALVPYWSLYLNDLGFSPVEIGELMALLMVTKVVAPNVWGWIADQTGRRMAIVRLGSFLAVAAFTGVFFAHGYWGLAAVMTVFSFFWNAALPQYEATTFNHLGTDTHRYARIRLWGSIGFILTSASLGPLLDRYDIALLPWVTVWLMAGIWLASMVTPEDGVRQGRGTTELLRRVLARGDVLALLIVCFLMQASHGPYYTFYSLYLESYDYSRTLIGQLWALGVVAEVVVFLLVHRFIPQYGLRALLLVSLLLTTIRWTLIALFPERLAVLLLAQCFHAASFGIYHAVAIQLIHRYFIGHHQGRGQALYSSVSFGAGGAVGSLFSGYMWDNSGAMSMYLAAALISAAAMGIAWRWVRA